MPTNLEVFILMSFGRKWNDVYHLVMQRLPEQLPITIRRADELPFDNRQIYDQIVEGISSARVIIADLSDNNPNVFYELGYAHALGKIVVPICSRPLPFDVAGFRVIRYSAGALNELFDELVKTLRQVLSALKLRGPHGHGPDFPFSQREVKIIRDYALQRAKNNSWKRPDMYFSRSELSKATGIDETHAYQILNHLRECGLVTAVNWKGEPVWFHHQERTDDQVGK